ncbi:MAG: transposase, partial [Nanoarchaeota archaeon]|nr:transposase [Nanoarchaeota archaeon]
RIPKYFSKFSKKIFTSWQHIILLVFRQHERKSYRDFTDWLSFSKLPKAICLRRIPHFTTLQKFSARMKSLWFHIMMKTLCNIADIAGIDSTGFSLANSSQYFCSVIGRKVRKFMKLSMIGDMKKKLILVVRIRKKRRHDNIDFKPLLEKIKANIIVADRGYDSEMNHIIAGRQGIKFISPLRNNVPVCRTSGLHRKFLKRNFSFHIYRERNKCESIFSALKRRYGSAVNGRTFATQKNELLFRVLAYNFNRIASFILLLYEDFY